MARGATILNKKLLVPIVMIFLIGINIVSAIELVDSQPTSTDNTPVGNTVNHMQYSYFFQPNETYTINWINISTARTNAISATSYLGLAFYACDGSKEATGDALAVSPTTYQASIIPEAQVNYHNFSFNSFLVEEGNEYCIVINQTEYTADNRYIRVYMGDLTGAGNQISRSPLGAFSWTSVTTSFNLTYWIYGEKIDPDPVVVNLTAPSDSEDVVILGNANLTNWNNLVWINVSHNDTTQSRCISNDTTWDLQDESSGFAGFYNNTNLADGTYSINITCNRTDTTINGTVTSNFIMDTTNPTITASDILTENKTIVWNGTFGFNINFTDDREIYSINVSLDNGTDLYYDSNIGGTSYELNVAFGVDSQYERNLTARVCDSHTAKEISDLEQRIDKKGLKYVIEDSPLWFPDEYIHIYPKEDNSYTTPITNKLSDRYSFEFNKRSLTTGVETFVVYSTQNIDIAKDQNYAAHLIIKGLGENGYWIDFENNEATKHEIKRINDKTVEVTVYGLKGSSFQFNSIGELNCVSENYKYANINPLTSHKASVIIGESSTYTLLITPQSDIISSYLVNLSYNYTMYEQGESASSSQIVTAPTLIPSNPTVLPANWVVSINNTLYNITSQTQSVSDFFLDNCTSYNNHSLNISFFNATDDARVNATIKIFFNYSFQGVNKNYSLSTTAYWQDICIAPSGGTFITDMHIQYSGGDITFNYIDDDLTLTNESQSINLYTVDDTTAVKFTVTDTGGQTLEGVEIKVLEFDVGTGIYKLTQQLRTGVNGEAIGRLELLDTFYKFILVYQGQVRLDTSPETISSDTLLFQIDLNDDYYTTATTGIGVYTDLTFENTTTTFTCAWNSLVNLTQVCVKVEKHTLNGIFDINLTCSTGDSGAITAMIGENVNESTYVANCYATSNEGSLQLDTLSVSFNYDWKEYGEEGVWVSWLLIITLTMVGLWNIAVAIILMCIAVVVVVIMGFFHLTLTYLIGFILLGIITAIRLNKQ